MNHSITVEATVACHQQLAWSLYTNPDHIRFWNAASPDWHCPSATNELKPGGRFDYRMEAKDGSMGFNFTGVFNAVDAPSFLSYTMDDGRQATISFKAKENHTTVTVTFEPEQTNSRELQQTGWQAILDNYRQYADHFNKLRTLHFTIAINAPIEKVFSTMLSHGTYEQWTAEFNPTSTFEGSWEKGSDIRFLGTDANGKVGGMISRIRENIPNRFVSIEHIGMLLNGEAITDGPEVDAWAGSQENYAFSEENGVTTVKVSIDSNGGYEGYFNETYPKALNVLKNICEA
ncbi:MAG: SRPBCC domain-containing protein [Chitinophagaceae bacterium]|jgi:uncharacterized protein YndB with AHSA1/START domain|nr:SRPBCC domain-containing protein [Chitinophagaceae bacterium]